MIRRIQIEPALNGFVCQIGCQTVVFTSVDSLLEHLGDYLRDPEATEKYFIAKAGFNARHTLTSARPDLPNEPHCPPPTNSCVEIMQGRG